MTGNVVWDIMTYAACGMILIIVIVCKIHSCRRHK